MNMPRYNSVSFLVALVLWPICLCAQPSRFEVGLSGGVSVNDHATSFRKLGDFASCCPTFVGSSSVGPLFGAYVAVPVSPSFRIHARLLTSAEGATMVSDERSFVADLRNGASVVPALFRHEFSSTLATVGFEPAFAWRPFGSLEVLAGTRLALATTTTFTQTETLIEPEDFGSYLNTGRTWVNHDASIPDANALRIGALIALRYSLPLSRDTSIVLVPEASYIHDITGVTSVVGWDVHQFRFTLSVGWRPSSAPPPPPPPPAPEPPPTIVADVEPPAPVRPPLTATIVAEGIDSDGRRTPQPVIRVEEVLSSDLRPLLPYVYFDKGQRNIPQRYKQRSDISNFTETRLHEVGTLETYYDLLNIVGYRLRQKPMATVTITGCVSGTGADTGSVLARQRAEVVQQYLIQTWGIAPERLVVSPRGLPERPTRALDPADVELADEENRRVEIAATDPFVLAPVRTADTVRSANPPQVAFRIQRPQQSAVTRWKVTASQGNRVLFVKEESNGYVPSELIWKLDSTRTAMPSTEEPVNYTVELDDENGSTFRSPVQELRIQQLTISRKRTERIEDRELDKFALILFDFNDASIKGQNADIISLIKSKITAQSLVKIIGSADIIGAESYNRTLARNRAQETSKALGLSVRASLATGIGDQAPYTVQFPEGRAYSRTVVVDVETPIR